MKSKITFLAAIAVSIALAGLFAFVPLLNGDNVLPQVWADHDNDDYEGGEGDEYEFSAQQFIAEDCDDPEHADEECDDDND
jgi:hypothetical protein